MDSSFEEEYLEDVKMFELIGNGAFGKVYKGSYRGQDAAIKVKNIYMKKYRFYKRNNPRIWSSIEKKLKLWSN